MIPETAQGLQNWAFLWFTILTTTVFITIVVLFLIAMAKIAFTLFRKT